MKQLFLFLVISTFAIGLYSQENTEYKPMVSVKFDARFDGVATTFLDDKNDEYDVENGFVGRYLKIIVSGDISDKFSYSFRKRLYTKNSDPLDFFSATDWANVTYKINKKFSLTAGKQVVSIGTFEYDYAPIDVYFASCFWNNVNPFQIGVNFGYAPDENNQLFAQVVNSPFSVKSLEGIYAYNLIWYGKVNEWLNTIYSLNFIEYEKGHFINLIALGNKIKFNGGEVDIDYINRYAGNNTPFLGDYTLLSNVKFNLSDKFRLFVKGGYDVNNAQAEGARFVYDRYVQPGFDGGFYGAGMEFFPLKKDDLRIHAFFYSTSNEPQPLVFNIGIRWQMKVFER